MRLTGLTEAFDAVNAKGKPLQINVANVAEDPHQPRKEFDAAALQELADSIAARGVKTPISVHPDPVQPGKYIVNHGARRLRASLMAEKLTIPAFVDEQYDAYDQVVENLQRENLTPMELAMFMQKRIDAGDKKGDIARQLGKGVQAIAEHLALLNAPTCIEQAYASGATSPKTLYDLRRLHEQAPAEVDEWCAGMPEISRKSVAELAAKLRHDVISVRDDAAKTPKEAEQLRHDVKTKAVERPENLVMTKKPPPPAVMTVLYKGRRATVASNSTLILVYENADSGCDGETAEVQLSEVEIVEVVKI